MAMGDGWSRQKGGSFCRCGGALTECRRPIIGLLLLPTALGWSISFATLRVDSISAASFAAAYLFMGRRRWAEQKESSRRSVTVRGHDASIFRHIALGTCTDVYPGGLR